VGWTAPNRPQPTPLPSFGHPLPRSERGRGKGRGGAWVCRQCRRLLSKRVAQLLLGALPLFAAAALDAGDGGNRTSAFVLQGRVESEVAGKHWNSGVFSVNASGSNAMIEVVYENGYSEVVGTDGRDSFRYGSSYVTNAPTGARTAVATIVAGRFPADAHPFAQVLWLFCTRDPQLLSLLGETSLYFYQDYTPAEVKPLAEVSDMPPGLISAIRWYAPGHSPGTNNYPLAEYPTGWLLASGVVTETSFIDGLALPGTITMTRYATYFITNASQLATLSERAPEDVRAVGRVLFSVTNAYASRALATYVPGIPDPNVRVHDKRINVFATVESGKWWTVGEAYANHEAPSCRRTQMRALLVILVLVLVPLIALLAMWRNRLGTSRDFVSNDGA
jgi:hypothetical protein